VHVACVYLTKDIKTNHRKFNLK
jgi:hypothetical protein